MKARWYQEKGVELIKNAFKDGYKRVLLWAMTGAGKGYWMAILTLMALNNNGKVIIVMRRRPLIFQSIKTLKKYFNIESTPIMGSLKTAFNARVLVCSIDTLARRITKPEYDFIRMEFTLCIIDETHDATSESYERFIWWYEGYELSDYTPKLYSEKINDFKKYFIGMTATPHAIGKKHHRSFQCVAKPIEAHELMDEGFLVPAKIFSPKNKIDLVGIRKTGGDFNDKDLFERVSKLEIVGDTVNEYVEKGENKPAVVFCVNVEHSKMVAKAFNDYGIPAIHCDADHTQEERDDAISGLKSGKYKILTNCNIFSVGFDAPLIEVEISARPTDSVNLALQQWGRVLRPYKICICGNEYGGDESCFKCGSKETTYEKKYAIIIDQASNCARHGLPYDIRFADLTEEDVVSNKERIKKSTKDCPSCYLTMHSHERNCPSCGFDFSQPRHEREINHVEGELVEIDQEFLKNQKWQIIQQKYNQLKMVEMTRHFDYMWKYIKLYEEFSEELFSYCDKLGINEIMVEKLRLTQFNKTSDLILKKGLGANNAKVYR